MTYVSLLIFLGKNINTEVKKVMGPSNFLINYDSTMRSMSSTSIPIAAMKYPLNTKKDACQARVIFKKRLLSSALCQLNQNLLQGLKS